jgi:hypothetical protein
MVVGRMRLGGCYEAGRLPSHALRNMTLKVLWLVVSLAHSATHSAKPKQRTVSAKNITAFII